MERDKPKKEHNNINNNYYYFLQRDETPPDPQLQLLLSIADLLAACAEGKHLFIESVCQNIFSIKEIVK